MGPEEKTQQTEQLNFLTAIKKTAIVAVIVIIDC